MTKSTFVKFLSLFAILFYTSFSVSAQFEVTFRVDMSGEFVSSSGVHIAGDFQSEAGLGDDWNPGSTEIFDADGDMVYEITVDIPAGTYQYKFVNGNNWGSEENPPSDCSVSNFNNREVNISGNIVLPAVPFNGCVPSTKLAVNMTGQNIAPEGVFVMGNFQEAAGFGQNWDPGSTRMTDLNGDGTYEVELSLPPGEFEYLFLNGNNLSGSETLSSDCTMVGDNGTNNRTFNTDDNLPVYCFNSCEQCHPAVTFEYDTHWWNDAVFYEIFVRSFYDSNGDGIGDFQGMIEKLDYLNDGDPTTKTDLGVTGIWLMPMMESPSYHGYDVTDYYATEPDYGSMADFEAFLDAAHERGIKVIIDFVMNHSSSQHPWFTQSANNANGFRDWYRWADNHPGYSGPWGQNVWHSNGGDFYYGLFWGGMPDLNYENPDVKEEMFNVTDFWLDKGIDGYRLDAIKYLDEDGSTLENTPETFALLEEFNSVYKSNNPEAFTVGEVWSSTSQIIPYVQNDRLDVCFEFGLATAIINAVNSQNPNDIRQQLNVIQTGYPQLQYSTFLTNHDIDRVFNQLGSQPTRMKLAASIYLTLPGIPFVYYGEELGMIGTGDHENIRRPMQWTDGTHAGFSTSTPWYGVGNNYQSNNVETMEADPNSLLEHYKKMIHIRNEQVTLRRGNLLTVESSANQVLSFARVYGNEAAIVLSNMAMSEIKPTLGLDISSLPAGNYFVTDLVNNQNAGTININAEGGFSGWEPIQLAARETAIYLISNENPVNIKEVEKEENAITVSPNPFGQSTTVSIKNKSVENGTIQLYDNMGRLISETRFSGSQVEVQRNDLKAGIYHFMIFENGKEIGSGKLVVK